MSEPERDTSSASPGAPSTSWPAKVRGPGRGMHYSSLFSVDRPGPAQTVPQRAPCHDPSVSRGSRGVAWGRRSPPYQSQGRLVPRVCGSWR